MNKIKILAIVGSLRQESINKNLLKSVIQLAPENLEIETWGDLGNLPLFNQDQEKDMPEVAKKFKEKIRSMDGILFVTPEYNRSIPGVLKNVIDWASRPYGDSAWAGKPAAIMGATGGNVGTALAQSHLRQVLLYLDMIVIGQPEFYLTDAMHKFDPSGNLTDEETKKHIGTLLEKFTVLINKLRG